MFLKENCNKKTEEHGKKAGKETLFLFKGNKVMELRFFETFESLFLKSTIIGLYYFKNFLT